LNLRLTVCWDGFSRPRRPDVFSRDAESEPPSQRNERSRGGRTAKATVALGTLPYIFLMLRWIAALRF
jgi:hypothetical protein